MLDNLMDLLYTLPGIIVALSFHEWAHAYAAYKMGDPTARNLGRMTLNPLAHIDPIGFLMMVIAHFGWAKPVPVNPNNYKSYRKGELVVSLAGVTMNLILAVFGAFLLALIYKVASVQTYATRAFSIGNIIIQSFIMINLSLMIFNLIPIYPLDGYHVAEVTLAKHLGPRPFIFLRNYGQYILIAILLFSNFSGISIIGSIVDPLWEGLIKLFFKLFGMM